MAWPARRDNKERVRGFERENGRWRGEKGFERENGRWRGEKEEWEGGEGLQQEEGQGMLVEKVGRKLSGGKGYERRSASSIGLHPIKRPSSLSLSILV